LQTKFLRAQLLGLSRPDWSPTTWPNHPILAQTEDPISRRRVSILKNWHRWVEWL